MRTIRYPLDELLKSSTSFIWTPECQQTFDKFKEILSSELLLTHYNPEQEIIVSADASSVGVGATISHKFPDGKVKVIQHASRALNAAEQRYSQPDRAGLAIVFAVTKFHKFIFGRRFQLQTDHAPLLRIFGSKKEIPVYTANRLQRWALTLLNYDFSMEYVPTDKFGNADVLSRLINHHAKPDEDFVVACTNLEDDLSMVQQATKTDPVLRKIHRFIRDGWPTSKSETQDIDLRRFHDRQEGLSIVQDCIMFGDRLVIPSIYRKRCLAQLHKGHPGMHRMKAVARSYVYWPGLDEEIASFVRACPHCAAAARSPPKANPGMPELLVTDNGTQFKSEEFSQYCRENGIQHVTTHMPFHPQSNGQAERFVNTFKRAVRKIQEGEGNIKQDLDVFLLTYRTTPNANVSGGRSPAEAMYNRPLRTSMDLLRAPREQMPAICTEATSSQPRTFTAKDPVYAKVYANNKWTWVSGIIVEKIGKVMYNVRFNKKIIRSHINQLRARAASEPDAEQMTQLKKQLPINILLNEWKLSCPASPAGLAATSPLLEQHVNPSSTTSPADMPFHSQHSVE
ncbi:uncharacterized protein K02A2.6-like [Toxorhynchites rutilus septentrionalis]|uniref:uncharacterized protein K02A2.6-like n=1 Tax=Toxorhynchites rutilus septentrionalis TaxID=329112 RepID=UPI00247A564C|nr:uncharacterized protein K02A2.6-like [Toxorhynchites rutilus septentrionalis]